MPQVSLFFFVTAKALTAVGQLPYARWVPSPLGPLRQLDELRTGDNNTTHNTNTRPPPNLFSSISDSMSQVSHSMLMQFLIS